MALSNWDSLSYGPDGLIADGEFKSAKNDCTLEIYKNWVHIGSEKMWQEGGSFTKPYIASINDAAEVNIGAFSINAIRHEDQNSIFIYAEETIYHPDYLKNADAHPPVTRRFAGIGCYGFANECKIYLERLGITPDPAHDWGSSSSCGGGEPEQKHLHNYTTHEDFEVPESMWISDDESWVGVTEPTLNAFFAWLDKLSDKGKEYPLVEFCAWVDKCRGAKPESFNQGDAFFAEHLGTETPKTEVGTSEPASPILIQALK